MTVIRGSGRPDRYVKRDGTRVPGTTTITGRFKDSGALIRWAWQQGRDGRELDEARDEAAAAGTLAHDMIEAHIHGVPCAATGTDEQTAKAKSALARFVGWIDGRRITITHTEVPLVSELHSFGGTLDALGRGPDGEVVLIDWKTSNGVYPEYVCQLGAYSLLVSELLGLRCESALLLRFDKTADVSTEHAWGRSVLDEAEKAFIAQRELYEQDKFFKRVCK